MTETQYERIGREQRERQEARAARYAAELRRRKPRVRRCPETGLERHARAVYETAGPVDAEDY